MPLSKSQQTCREWLVQLAQQDSLVGSEKPSEKPELLEQLGPSLLDPAIVRALLVRK